MRSGGHNFVNISDNNKNIKYKNTYNEVELTSVKYATMQEIRESKDEVLQKIKNNEYRNLIYKNTNISIAKCDSISKLKEHMLGLYKGIKDPNEMINMQMDIIYGELGRNLDENHIGDMNSIKRLEDGTCVGLYINEIKELIKNGEYDNVCELKVDGYSLPAMAYSGSSYIEGEYRYAHIESDFNSTAVFKGKIESRGEHSEYFEYGYTPLGVYYPEGDNLDDKYKLLGGEITIREAIAYKGVIVGTCGNAGEPKERCTISREVVFTRILNNTDVYGKSKCSVNLERDGEVQRVCVNYTDNYEKVDVEKRISVEEAIEAIKKNKGQIQIPDEADEVVITDVDIKYWEESDDSARIIQPVYEFNGKAYRDGKEIGRFNALETLVKN